MWRIRPCRSAYPKRDQTTPIPSMGYINETGKIRRPYADYKDDWLREKGSVTAKMSTLNSKGRF